LAIFRYVACLRLQADIWPIWLAGLDANEGEQWFSNKSGYHSAAPFRSVESNESVMCQVARVLKDDVENMIDGERATEEATM